jgi:hypothetical protein
MHRPVASRSRRGDVAHLAEEVEMIFQQFLYPETGCAAYVFG